MFGGSTIYNLGRVPFDEPLKRDSSEFRPAGKADLDDHIRQVGMGIAYRGIIGRTRLNAGILRSRYRKSLSGEGISDSELATSAWIYNISAAHEFSDWLTIYAGHSSGLEEAGVAPASAPNRYEVLPPAKARQYEVALVLQPVPAFKLVLGAFDLQRGYFGADGIGGEFRKLGDVRHRGIELSAAGTITKGLTAVLGGVILDPIVETSDAEENFEFRPIGVPRVKLQASADYEFGNGFHVDGTVQYSSSRPATAKSPTVEAAEVPKTLTVNAGLRAPLKVAGLASTVRFQVLNLLDDYAWDVSSSGTMAYSPSRTFRLALTTEF